MGKTSALDIMSRVCTITSISPVDILLFIVSFDLNITFPLTHITLSNLSVSTSLNNELF